MSGLPPDPRDIARFVRQRGELGAGVWIFEALARGKAIALAEGAHRSVPAAPWSTDPTGASSAPTTATGARAAPERAPPEPGPLPGKAAAKGTLKAATQSATEAAKEAARDASPAFEPPTTYDALREAALVCTRCPLSGSRKQVVFSDGNPDARVMVVGEAPGANEDRTGVPFVGRAGGLLDLLLAGVDLSRRDSVYICNVLKCRPPQNRNPQPDEIASCAPWLHRQIELVRPEAILAVGTFAGRLLTGRDMALGDLRGQVYTYRDTPLIVTYHPAALLRNSGWTRSTWEDLQLLRQVLDGS